MKFIKEVLGKQLFYLVLPILFFTTKHTYSESFSICGTIKGTVFGKNVYIGIAKSQEELKEKTFFKKIKLPANSVTPEDTKFCFTEIPSGKYIIAGYQDINNNGKLDNNNIGIPSEPYGSYHNTKSLFGPKFDKDGFELKNSINNAVIYFK